MGDNEAATGTTTNWRHVGAFLGLTFGLTWLLDLVIYLRGGLTAPATVVGLQLQMLLPAFCAVLLGLFFFPESPLYRGRPASKGRWFYYFYLLFTFIFAIGTVAIWLAPGQGMVVFISALAQLLSIVGLVLLIVLRFVAGREDVMRVWLAWGPARYWLLFGAAFVLYYILQAALNAVTGLGGATLEPQFPMPTGINPTGYLILAIVQTALVGPFVGLVITFGEEYGWRGYLQSELFKLGRVRGVLLVGVIWGLWHAPIILMGYNYPGYPALGVLLMTLYTMGLAVALGYAVLKARSVLLATFLHALNNQVASLIIALGFAPRDPVYSFMLGIYGLAVLAVVAVLILRDPLWRGRGGGLPEPALEGDGSIQDIG